MRPVIGITASLKQEDQVHGSFLMYMMNEGYVSAVVAAGGIPVVLPPQADPREILAVVDGLLFSGGPDVDPTRYGDPERHPETYGVSEERDDFELTLMTAALDADKPVLGVCRGIQVMNVALGGTLIQHTNDVTDVAHRQQEIDIPSDRMSHPVHVVHPAMQLLLGDDLLRVNSFHHQAIKELAPGLTAAGYSDDGLIEAVIQTDRSFFAGVQWHPELMFRAHAEHLRPFASLVAAAHQHKLAVSTM